MGMKTAEGKLKLLLPFVLFQMKVFCFSKKRLTQTVFHL